jgi:Fe-S-cluster containining protein
MYSLPPQVMRVFREVGREIAGLKLATGLRCVPGCGSCCESRHVEATVVEALPLAKEIYRRGEEEKILMAIDEKDLRGDPVCVLFRPNPHRPGHGRCAYYEFRFLVCRLFGFATRRGKSGKLEFSPCKIIKQNYPETVSAVDRFIGRELLPNNVEGPALRELEGPILSNAEGLKIPVYQETFMRIAALEPGTGFLRYPVNQAIRKALARFYWKRTKPHMKSA